MLVVTGLIKVDPADVAAARAAALEMMAETEKEKGCLHYRFSEDIGDPGVFRVYEEWESDEDLAAHAASAHMATFRAALGGLKLISRAVQAYVPTNVRDL